MNKQIYTKTRWLFLALIILMVQEGFAQKTITGTVADNDGEPLIGVNVLIKSTQSGTITDFEGNYQLEANDGDILLFSYLGYEPKEITVGTETKIDVVLISDAVLINEVVVVGYGTMRKRDVTGAIVSVRDKALTDVKVENVFEALQGRVPGMEVSRTDGRTGSEVDLLIRGKRSLGASNSPLVLVDGVPYGDDIDIAQEDIESIEILKDASSTAIYGSRGANGVILITTRRGTGKRSKITFNTYYGVSEPYQKVPVYDRDGYIKAKTDANRDIDDWETDPNPINVFPGDELTGYENGVSTDWQDLVSQTGGQQNYRLGFEGGGEKIGYNTSLSYFKEKGVMKSDEFERLTLTVNLDGQVNDYVTIGTSSVFSYKQRTGRGPRFTDAVLQSPIVEAFDSTGNYIYQPNFANPRKSPLAYLEDEEEDRSSRIFSTVYGEVAIIPGLNFRTNFNMDLGLSRFGFMYPQKVPTEGFTVSGVDANNDYSWLWNNILSYQTEFGGRHRLNAALVHEVQHYRYEYYGMSGQQQQFDQTLWYNLSTNMNQQTQSSLTESALVSLLGRVNYSFDEKYIVSLAGRYDGASQLSDGNKWDFFPAASVAWRINSESFLKDNKTISNLKLRLGYGVTGNAAIAPYSTAAALNIIPYYYQYGEPGSEIVGFGYRPEALASKDLRWEQTSQVNAGVDFGLFNDRLSGSVDIYTANTDKLLLEDKLPPTTGFDNVYVNAGQTKTWGWEVYLRAFIIDKENFDWTAEVSYFGSREEITQLASGLTEDEGNGWFVGHPIDVYYDFEKTGIWQLGEEDNPLFTGPGTIKVADTDGNDTLNFDDRIVLGTPRPKWIGSFVTTFNLFNFDLSLNFYARMGQMIDAAAYSYDPRMYDNMIAVDYWTPLNPTNEYPAYNSALAELPYEYTLRYRDGSFVKLRNVTLGYTFPASIIEHTPFKSLRLYASGNNVAILYSKLFDGLDPERNGSIEWPLARLWLFGLDVSF